MAQAPKMTGETWTSEGPRGRGVMVLEEKIEDRR
jgi:hypothetical protein